jgi:4-amino-4-deoxy-L-arabinose transferase-like glycosyltransferase
MDRLKSMLRRSDEVTAALLLALAVLAYWLTSPTDADFWWSDTGQHALNGALLHDFLASGRLLHPMQFAVAYYLKYPAFNIALYPPLFPVAEALVYTVMGVSHTAAQLTVALFTAVGVYYLFRCFATALPTLAAAGAVMLLLAMPAVALWSRQVMLEMPSLALLAAATFYLLRHLETGRARCLYYAVVLLCAGIYIRQPAAFAILPFAAILLQEFGVRVLAQRSTWYAAALGFMLLVPLAAFTLLTASHYTAFVSGIGPDAESKFSPAALSWYARALPDIAGPLPILASLGYLALLAVRGWTGSAERRLGIFMIAWFVAYYLFISPIAHRETRYGFYLAVPLAVFSAGLVVRVIKARAGSLVTLCAGIVAFALTIATNHVPYVRGYDKAAAYVLAHAQPGSVVLFHGLRSPNFVFALRALSPEPKVGVLRAEKILTDYKILREWGIQDRGLSTDDIQKIFDRYGIEYVVFQPDFWTDLPSIARLQDFVSSDHFAKVADIRVDANFDQADKVIEIFRNKHPVAPSDQTVQFNIQILGKSISGRY